MGFIRQQQERLAVRYLQWQYQKMNLPLPTPSELEGQARRIVEEAHQIARNRGRNVIAIIKELIKDIRG
ncbi:MAG: hypothetical protein ISS65_00815 [Desulfobacterales bacterium]|uniref:Uncharacterized protein n=1 Tax=Candidatus Desulfatibia profunda TaxID=2841695 RepID=A0A8J6NK39_9BACT|nr:hypothetical protein [Candidatus Desulfatibia profunda]MBL7178738.1 hypothetical protein [Desulfobacterales bacterium]